MSTFIARLVTPVLYKLLTGPMEEEAALRDLVDGAAEHLPLVVRAKLREWVSRAFVQFRAFDVRRALRDAEFVG